MFITFEGPSCAGKSTLSEMVVNSLRESDNPVVKVRGPGQLNVPENWERYNRYMHSVYKDILNANDDLIMVGDRSFSEAVITGNNDLIRRYKCYSNVLVVYVTASVETLKDRGSLDATDEIERLEHNYQSMIFSTFDHVKVDTEELSEFEATDKITDKIAEKLQQ